MRDARWRDKTKKEGVSGNGNLLLANLTRARGGVLTSPKNPQKTVEMQEIRNQCLAFISCTYKQLRACKYRVGEKSKGKVDKKFWWRFVFFFFLPLLLHNDWLDRVFFPFRFGHRWAAIAKTKSREDHFIWIFSHKTTRVPKGRGNWY